MKNYNIAKLKAQNLANSKGQTTYISKSVKQNHYKIEFTRQTSPHYEIIEEIYPICGVIK